MRLLITALLASLLVSACGANTTAPAVSPAPPTQILEAPTETLSPSDTPVPTEVIPTATTEPTSPPQTATLTEEQKQAAEVLLNGVCAVCHSPNKVNSVKADQAGWERIINRMQQKGAVISDAEIELLAQYLAETP